jgi:tetratricopeptide (TPR) repeat protein
MGKYDEAIRAYDEAIVFWEKTGRNSNSAIAWNAKGNTHLAKGKAFEVDGNHVAASSAYENAIEACERAIELKPDAAKTWRIKGNALRAQKKYYEAIHAYDKAIEFEPLHPDAWNLRGNALADLGKYYHSEGLESLRSYAMAINIHSNDGLLWLNNGCALFKQVNYYFGEALRSFDMAIDLNPRDGKFWLNKCNILRLFGRTDEASASACNLGIF